MFDLEAALAPDPPQGIHGRRSDGSTRIVGIDGHGGAGKSTLARYVADRMQIETVHTDDFASWDNPKDWRPLVSEQVLEPIRTGARTLSYQRSQWWPGHRPEPVVDQPVTDVVVLEGVGSLRREFRPYLSVALLRRCATARVPALLGGAARRRQRWAARKRSLRRAGHQWFDDEVAVHGAGRIRNHSADVVVRRSPGPSRTRSGLGRTVAERCTQVHPPFGVRRERLGRPPAAALRSGRPARCEVRCSVGARAKPVRGCLSRARPGAGQVDGVVAEALVEPGHHRQLDGDGQGHGAGHQLGRQRDVQVVELVVDVVDGGGRLG